ncbi:NfeD family protein [Devosia chinhatensis]|uniref:NfeD-like C-terminal domain-containing protein n=1 Tax=Devosia chinhatensis TaxID=429727 RepID=A0A0F5FGZ0_9HYPH|nr:NfeD family protein [Devosia chinhatensis]KKB07855.1 hypothetical protein VE26_14540 [Devosia chinhatensis]
MELFAQAAAYGPWAWIVGGLILLGLELVVPGGFLVWLGIAGILTGLLTLVQPLAWPVQWLVFGTLALGSILVWTRLARHRRLASAAPELNQRTDRLIGQEAVLASPIVNGFGRMPVGDTIWRVSGPDLMAGQRVRITGADGAVLRVEPVEESLP